MDLPTRSSMDKLFVHLLRCIEPTLNRINADYRPGILAGLKKRRKPWREMLELERRINSSAFRNDELQLEKVLNEYGSFWRKICSQQKIEQGSASGRGHGQDPGPALLPIMPTGRANGETKVKEKICNG